MFEEIEHMQCGTSVCNTAGSFQLKTCLCIYVHRMVQNFTIRGLLQALGN